jgi:hypothetical protein
MRSNEGRGGKTAAEVPGEREAKGSNNGMKYIDWVGRLHRRYNMDTVMLKM